MLRVSIEILKKFFFNRMLFCFVYFDRAICELHGNSKVFRENRKIHVSLIFRTLEAIFFSQIKHLYFPFIFSQLSFLLIVYHNFKRVPLYISLKINPKYFECNSCIKCRKFDIDQSEYIYFFSIMYSKSRKKPWVCPKKHRHVRLRDAYNYSREKQISVTATSHFRKLIRFSN